MKNIILAAVLLITVNACTRKEVGAVSFDVTTTSASYNVGDSVIFNFSGNPDYIVFYSGENGSNYQNRKRISAVGTPILSFLSYEQYGNHTNTLHLMISSDFVGTYDSASLESATWTEITNRANLSLGKDSTPSGNIILSDFVHQDTPVYVAFKYADQQDGINSQRTWTIRNLQVINKLQDSTSTLLLDIPNSIWLGINLLNPAVKWNITSTYLSISGGNKTALSNEDWVISQPIYLNKVNPDAGVSIKTLTDPVLKSYYHVFTKPGNYTVVFDATNASLSNMTEAVKTLNITIK